MGKFTTTLAASVIGLQAVGMTPSTVFANEASSAPAASANACTALKAAKIELQKKCHTASPAHHKPKGQKIVFKNAQSERLVILSCTKAQDVNTLTQDAVAAYANALPALRAVEGHVVDIKSDGNLFTAIKTFLLGVDHADGAGLTVTNEETSDGRNCVVAQAKGARITRTFFQVDDRSIGGFAVDGLNAFSNLKIAFAEQKNADANSKIADATAQDDQSKIWARGQKIEQGQENLKIQQENAVSTRIEAKAAAKTARAAQAGKLGTTVINDNGNGDSIIVGGKGNSIKSGGSQVAIGDGAAAGTGAKGSYTKNTDIANGNGAAAGTGAKGSYTKDTAIGAGAAAGTDASGSNVITKKTTNNYTMTTATDGSVVVNGSKGVSLYNVGGDTTTLNTTITQKWDTSKTYVYNNQTYNYDKVGCGCFTSAVKPTQQPSSIFGFAQP